MRWFAVVLVALLSGCTGSPVEDVRDAAALEVRSPPPAGTDDFVADDEPTAMVDNATPGVLTASLTASSINGSAPVLVNFTLGALNLTAGAVEWTLNVTMVVGNVTAANVTAQDAANASMSYTGLSLPANVTHNFTVAGLFNVTLTVVQGAQNSSVTLPVNILAGEPLPAAPGFEPIIVTGTTTVPGNPATSGTLGSKACAGFMAGQNGRDCIYGTLPATTHGRNYAISQTTSSSDYEFLSTCSPNHTVVRANGGPDTGTVPPGTGCVVMWFFGAGTGTFTMTIT